MSFDECEAYTYAVEEGFEELHAKHIFSFIDDHFIETCEEKKELVLNLCAVVNEYYIHRDEWVAYVNAGLQKEKESSIKDIQREIQKKINAAKKIIESISPDEYTREHHPVDAKLASDLLESITRWEYDRDTVREVLNVNWIAQPSKEKMITPTLIIILARLGANNKKQTAEKLLANI